MVNGNPCETLLRKSLSILCLGPESIRHGHPSHFEPKSVFWELLPIESNFRRNSTSCVAETPRAQIGHKFVDTPFHLSEAMGMKVLPKFVVKICEYQNTVTEIKSRKREKTYNRKLCCIFLRIFLIIHVSLMDQQQRESVEHDIRNRPLG